MKTELNINIKHNYLPKKVLIIDASLMYAIGLRNFLQKTNILSKSDYDIKTDISAFDYKSLKKYSAIFIDLAMYKSIAPEINALIATNDWESKKFIITCNSICDNDLFQLVAWKVNGVIPKSISLNHLETNLIRIFEQKRYIDIDIVINQIQIENKFNTDLKFKKYLIGLNSNMLMDDNIEYNREFALY